MLIDCCRMFGCLLGSYVEASQIEIIFYKLSFVSKFAVEYHLVDGHPACDYQCQPKLETKDSVCVISKCFHPLNVCMEKETFNFSHAGL